MPLHAIALQLTFAGLHALNPAVISVCAAGPSAVLEPSTARSATTDSARFREHTALWTRLFCSDRWGDVWRANY